MPRRVVVRCTLRGSERYPSTLRGSCERPPGDVRAGTCRCAEAAQVERVRRDPGRRKPRSDVPMAPGVLGDPMYEKEMCARDAGRWPSQRAQLEAVARASGPEEDANAHAR